jgi:hypothetical protein
VSSAILYLAIVAIWAFMLVPRWLRRSHTVPAADTDAPAETEQQAQAQADPDEDQPEPDTAPIPAVTGPPADAPERPSAPASAYAEAAAASPSPSLKRAKVLQARRRLLTTLILLAVAAASCTALKLTSGWVCVPPAGMLGMYLLLLREAALADAENARWRAQQTHAARQRALAQAQARDEARQAWAARTPQPTAQVIDISARLGDQLYDQYADATMRAVGD